MIIIAAEPGKKAYVTEIESGSGAIREFLAAILLTRTITISKS